jgi:hypothetical protein
MRQDDIEAERCRLASRLKEYRNEGRRAARLAKCNARKASLQSGDVGEVAFKLFNIRTKFVRTFGQPAGSCG